ncbi:MAG: LysM peptidoglycan-binding domain-containing protein [Chloroflexi bacterium]|nr:LysM peptidoglycan-binding domain-containing protein [Chloroflexota bacterium]
MKGLRQTEFTPWLLSLVFGVWILVMSGVAGFYVPGSVPPPPIASTATPRSAQPVGPASGAQQPLVAPKPPPAATPTGVQATPTARTPTPAGTPPSSPTPKATATPTTRIHVVGQGDTLSEIAEKYGISTQALMRANGITDPDKLAVGDKLTIPAP